MVGLADTKYMTTNAPLIRTLTPDVCAKVTATMHPVVQAKIEAAFAAAQVAGHNLIAADGTSPAGEYVMARMNEFMTRQRWAQSTRRMVRFDVRVIGMNLIRDAYEITAR